MIFEQLSTDIIETMLTEIKQADDLFNRHNINGGSPLHPDTEKQGSTIWLHTRELDSCWLRTDLFSYTCNFLKEFQSNINSRFSRVYVHKLQPGNCIVRHFDQNDQMFANPNFNRYQIWFKDVKNMYIESTPMPVDNCLMWFDHSQFHEYKNYSDRTIYFIVFDLISN
jgi:hypothetical protein